jgi:hypothetical protein
MEKRSINNQNKGTNSPTSNSKDSKNNPTPQKKAETPSTKKSTTTNKSASVNEQFSKNIPPVKTLNEKVAEAAKAAKQQPTQPKQPAKSINELYAANNKNTTKQEPVKKVVTPPVKKVVTKPTDTKKASATSINELYAAKDKKATAKPTSNPVKAATGTKKAVTPPTANATKANQQPITNNQQPTTKNQQPKTFEPPVLKTVPNPAVTENKVKQDLMEGKPRQKNAHLVEPALKAARFHQKLQKEMGIKPTVSSQPVVKSSYQEKKAAASVVRTRSNYQEPKVAQPQPVIPPKPTVKPIVEAPKAKTSNIPKAETSKAAFSSFLEKPVMTYQTNAKGGQPDEDQENNYWKAPISQQEQAPKKRSYSLKEFFLFSSGVDRDVLQHCPSDESRFIGVGGTVIFTGILAFLSSSYAIFTVFDSWPMAIFFGMVWGFMIYNLDRYIVASMKNHGKWWKDWSIAFPRLVMAVLLALVISKPLELKIFEKEINAELVSMEQEVFNEQEEKVKTRFITQIENYETTAQELETKLLTLRQKRDTLEMMALAEADGSGGSGKRNMGPIYKAKRADADNARAEFESEKARIMPMIEFNKEKAKDLKSEMEEEMANLDQESYGGLAARMEALHRLGEQSEAIYWASLMIMLLFVIVEISPVLVKLISSKTSYDYLSMHKEHAIKMATQEEIAEANKYLENRLKFESETNDYRTSAMIMLEKEMIDDFVARKRATLRTQSAAGKKPSINTEVRNIGAEAKAS